MKDLLALLVVVPLLAAPVCAILPRNRLPWVFATTVSWVVFAIAIAIVAHVQHAGALDYAMGGWAPPWGIEYRMDTLGAFVALTITAIGAVTTVFAGTSVDLEIARVRHPHFFATYLLALTGLLGITATGDVFNLFVFLEISSLASYILISQGSDRRALTAAYQYLITGTIGATFYLIGIGLLYAMTGTLNMADLGARLPAVSDTRTVHTAFAFTAVGVGIKLALFPLHSWLPGAYTYAPSVVSAFLASTATKVALYVLVRLVFTVFGAAFVFQATPFGWVIAAAAVAAMLTGSGMALVQSNVKRLLAYSSVAQIGYMVLGIAMATTSGLMAGLLHLFNHALMKGALFLAIGCVVYRVGSAHLGQLRGLGAEMPWTMAAFAIGGLSLVGMPLTAGFITKWYLIVAALERGWWPAVVVILVASLLALAYVWRVIETVWFREPEPERKRVKEAPLALLVPTWVLALATLYFGIRTEFSTDLAARAAAMLTKSSL